LQSHPNDVTFCTYPIHDLDDVSSEQSCDIYLRTLLDAIQDLQRKYPDREIALSLSGGRKGMSVLTFFAAQRAGIERVYHTLIGDVELEKHIEEETSIAALERLPTQDAQAMRLFLEEKSYDRDQFRIFPIPVIPLGRSA